jgi:peptidoglycan/LPS O-acetylase OafA/YrhL
MTSLDGVRGIAALAIVMFHYDIFFLPQAGLSHFVPGVGRAYLAVDLFLLMSGFVMAYVYGHAMASDWRTYWLEFAKARFARIYPLFAFTTLAMVIAVAASGMPLRFVAFSSQSLVLQPLMMQSWFPGLSWNYPSWSLSTEALAYVVFIFSAGPLLRGRYPSQIAVCCLAVLAGLSIVHGGSLNFFHGVAALLRMLSEFTLGVVLFRLHSSKASFAGKWPGVIAAALIGLAVLVRQDSVVVAALGCLICYSVGAKNAVSKVLNSRPAIALGNWSYSIYLWHVPVHYTVMAALAGNGHPVSHLGASSARLLLGATILAVIALSAVSYPHFEMPMRRLLLRRVHSAPVEMLRDRLS